jgi:hypothetical protein
MLKISKNKTLYTSYINLIIKNLNINFNFNLYVSSDILKKQEIMVSIFKHIKSFALNKISNNEEFKELINDILNKSIADENYELTSVLRDILNNDILFNSNIEHPKKKSTIKVKKNN